jgi:hypothetical protein
MRQDGLLGTHAATHDDEDPDLAFMDAPVNAGDTPATTASIAATADEPPAEDEEDVLDAAAARRSAMHDRERDVRLGRLHGKGRKPRPMFADD